MGKFLIRQFAFLFKELNETLRQPRLIFSLIVGPFFILLLFGVGYRTDRPIIRTVLVIPEAGLEEVDSNYLRRTIEANFELVEVSTDRAAAMQRIDNGDVELMLVIPADIEARALSGQPLDVEFVANTINPLNENWIKYLAYAQVNEINRTLLLRSVQRLQQETTEINQQLATTRADLDKLDANVSDLDKIKARESLSELRRIVGVLAASPLLLQQVAGDSDVAQTQAEFRQLENDLNEIDDAIAEDRLDEEQQRITDTDQRIQRLEANTRQISDIPADVIVSPLRERYENVRGTSFDLMTFYAPGVLALIVQHIAVTFAAMSLVRERLLGTMELFQIAPISSWQMISGKYASYTIVIGVLTAALIGLMYSIGIPFAGSVVLFTGLVILSTIASLGIGFLISSFSRTDSQAVQLSMLVLLFSVFFGGFFLPIENFWRPVQIISYVLPLTHTITALRDIMLRGVGPAPFQWAGLGLIAGITFAVVVLIGHLQFRRA